MEIEVSCHTCRKKFYRNKYSVQRSIKRGRNMYCSDICQYPPKPLLTCLECNKEIPKNKDGKVFCNHSCSAVYNNKQRGLKTSTTCLSCGKRLSKNRKYCNIECQHTYSWNLRVSLVDHSDLKSQFTTPKTQKKYLLYMRGHRCELCKLEEWQGLPVPLVLDHINGNPNDDSYVNLRLVCGNCDMQLPTYKSKNKGNGRHYRKTRYHNGESY